MSRFIFRLQTLLKLRTAKRDQCREQLADAYQVDGVLEQQLKEIQQIITQARQLRHEASQPGEINVDGLLDSHRHALILRAEFQTITNQREQVHAEIERRRLALVEADRAIKVLDKLRDNQMMKHLAAQEKSEIRQMDEIALRRTLVRRKDVRS